MSIPHFCRHQGQTFFPSSRGPPHSLQLDSSFSCFFYLYLLIVLWPPIAVDEVVEVHVSVVQAFGALLEHPSRTVCTDVSIDRPPAMTALRLFWHCYPRKGMSPTAYRIVRIPSRPSWKLGQFGFWHSYENVSRSSG